MHRHRDAEVEVVALDEIERDLVLPRHACGRGADRRELLHGRADAEVVVGKDGRLSVVDRLIDREIARIEVGRLRIGEPAAQHLPRLVGGQKIRRLLHCDGAFQRVRLRIEGDGERKGVRAVFDDHDIAAHAVCFLECGVLAVELVDVGIVEHGAVLRSDAARVFQRAVGEQELVARGERPRLRPGTRAVRLVCGNFEHFIGRVLQRSHIRAPVCARKDGLCGRFRRRIAVDIPGVIGAVYRHFGRVAVAHDRDGADVLILRVRREREGIVAAHGDGDVHLSVAKPRAGRAHVFVFNKVLTAARAAALFVVRVPYAVRILNAELELVADVQVDRDRELVFALRLCQDIAVRSLNGPAVPADRRERPARRGTPRDRPLAGILRRGGPQRVDVRVPLDRGIETPVEGEVRRRIPPAEGVAVLRVLDVRGREFGDFATFFDLSRCDDRRPVVERYGERLRRRLLLAVVTRRGDPEREREHHNCRYQQHKLFQF